MFIELIFSSKNGIQPIQILHLLSVIPKLFKLQNYSYDSVFICPKTRIVCKTDPVSLYNLTRVNSFV